MKLRQLIFVNIFLIAFKQVRTAYDYSTGNVCDRQSVGKNQSQVSYMCNHQALGSCNLQQAASDDGYSSFAEYGVAGYGSDAPNSCCRCFQVQVQDGDAPAKDLIVQGVNTGGDVMGNQIDLSMIAGGFGANNGCANTVYAWSGGQWDGQAGPAQYPKSKAGDWCSDPTQDNMRCQNSYSGGIRKRSDCSKLPESELVSLCQYSFDTKWRVESTGLRDTLMKEIRCPAGLRKVTGCDRDDSSLPNPTGKLKAGEQGVYNGKLTTMWDCCKPSCSWAENVRNAKGTAVMNCDAVGNVLGLGQKQQCVSLNCHNSCGSCSASNDSTKCTSCKDGFYLSSNPGSCIQCSSNLNCKTTCKNATQCNDCKDGYILQNDGTCKLPCHSSCVTCSVPADQNKCTKCSTGFYLSGQTEGQCITCPSSLNCSDCINSTECKTCKPNYDLQNDKTCKAGCDSSCKACSVPQNSQKCTQCKTGFYLNGNQEGSCVQCPSNCSSCLNGSQCDSCINNTILVNGACKSCESPCLTCEVTTSTCKSCIQGYEMNGNTCKPQQNTGNCHSACKTCSRPNDQNACTSCVDGQLVLGNNCQPCQPVCKTCSGDPNSCTSCPTNFKLQGNKCVGDNQDQTKCHSSCMTCSVQNDQNACTQCYPGFLILGNNNCQPCQPQCKTCSGDPNSCTSCPTNFKLQGNKCVGDNQDQTKCHSSCKTCSVQNDQNACTSCYTGFLILGNNNCQPCQPQCKNCINNPNNCSECSDGYGLRNGQCVKLISNSLTCHSSCQTCEQPNNANSCVTCMDGFVISSNNNCVTCNSSCKLCSNTPDKCTLCNPGYVLLESKCVQQDELSLTTQTTYARIIQIALFAWISILILI